MTTPSPDPDGTLRLESDTRYTSYPRTAQAQFAPGTIVAGRYRIAGILGSGGMGEVYRADDIKLDQPVALKFLPARLARDPILLARLHDEVRLGRQVAHPNVCRIYDIVDWEGAHFVAMEFVDGEDLARLLRRIGRVAHDKAVDIARGIAAGLLAAHAKGILHRDLKPANVMIDSHGEARIMDFGLALAAGEDDGTISGTPAYMAPEQLEGAPATIQSDLYALGLVMYELFTGRRAHNARTIPERVRDLSSDIATPSEVIRDIDPAVERLILRCLDNEASQRPRSAREVIEALPGGDPLAAAMAAGETPSPGMVAAAGVEGSLSRTAAWSLLAAVVVLFAVHGAMRSTRKMSNVTAPLRSPHVLHDRAQEILRTFGVNADGTPVSRLQRQSAYVAWFEDAAALRHGPALFVYQLAYGVTRDEAVESHKMTAGPGRTTIEVDPHGRLTFLLAAPPQDWKPRPLDPAAVLRAAGLDPARMKPAATRFAPPVPFDRYVAWSGTYPNDKTPVRAELASWHGTPTFFRITGPWDEVPEPEFAFENREAGLFVLLVLAFLFAAAILLAWRNLRLRRGDRQGAWRVGLGIFALTFAAGAIRRGATGDVVEAAQMLLRSAGDALAGAVASYIVYIAIEPVVRRRWPRQLISWTRLLSGRWRDPMIGRDILIGVIGGLAHAVIAASTTFVLVQLAGKTAPPNLRMIEMFSGVRSMAAWIPDGIMQGVAFAFLSVGILAVLTILFRKRLLAVAGLAAIYMAFFFFATGGALRLLPFLIVLGAVLVYIVARFGLLACAVTNIVFEWLFHIPPLGAPWATPLAAMPFVATVLLALWGFYTSLGGQSPFSASLLDE